MRAPLSEGKHRIVEHADPDLSLLGDEDELYSAFSNIAFNAVQHSPAGGDHPPAVDAGWVRRRSALRDRYRCGHRSGSHSPPHGEGSIEWTRPDRTRWVEPGWGSRSSSMCSFATMHALEIESRPGRREPLRVPVPGASGGSLRSARRNGAAGGWMTWRIPTPEPLAAGDRGRRRSPGSSPPSISARTASISSSARSSTATLDVVDRLREPVRLAAGLDEHRRLRRDAIERALACLRRFGQRLRGISRARGARGRHQYAAQRPQR